METSARTRKSTVSPRLIERAISGERVVVGKNAKKAVLVSVQDADILERLEDEADAKLVAKRMKTLGKTISFEQVLADLGL